MTTKNDRPASGRYSDAWWNFVAADLEAQRAERRRNWGDIDDMLLVRYEEGVCTKEEKERVEQAMRDFPAIRESLEIGRELNEGLEPAAPPNPGKQTRRAPGITPASVRQAETPGAGITIGPVTIQIDAADQFPYGRGRPQPKTRGRWMAAAAAVAAIVGLGLVYRFAWRQAGPGAPPEIVKKDSPPPKKPSTIIVEKVKGGADNQIPKFEDTLSALEKRSASGISRDELRKSYEKLLNDYPGHKAEIDGSRFLASVLDRPAPLDREKTKEVIAHKPSGTSPPGSEDTDGDALLARIAPYAGKPLPVRDAKLRELRAEVVRYQQQHPEAKNPQMEAFAAASEPSARNELLYAEARAKELMDSPKEATEVRELRGAILTMRLRDDTRPLVLQSKPLIGFMKLKQMDEPAAKAAEMKTEAVALTGRLSKPDVRGPYLFCVLPPAIRGEAVALYKDIQAFARKPGFQPDASLLDYITRARRPIKQDTLGMIIPMFIYPDRNNPGPWDQVLGLGNQGVRIKVIIAPNFDNAQEADPAYVAVIDRAHQNGIEVLGQVSCPGGQEGLAAARRQITQWHSFYPNRLDGLFFANQGVDPDLVQPYAALYRDARVLENHWQIVACPRSPCKEEFLTATGADILCPSSNPAGPFAMGWEAKYDPEHFAAIINDVTDETLVPDFLMTAVEKHFGWLYVGSKDPFRVMPSYLLKELSWIQDMNHLILNGNTPAPARRPNPAASKKRGARKVS